MIERAFLCRHKLVKIYMYIASWIIWKYTIIDIYAFDVYPNGVV